MNTTELAVCYPYPHFPFVATAYVLIDYKETVDGKEIKNVYIPESVNKEDLDYVRKEARKQFYNGSY